MPTHTAGRALFPTALLLLLAVSALIPRTAHAQPNAIDVTGTFCNAGIEVDHLLVYRINGILLMRGTATDSAKVEAAGQAARRLGYERIANLIEVTEASDDPAIVRAAEGSLGQHPSLDGCKFHIDSMNGVVRIGGRVEREPQKGLAIELLLRIKGVKRVQCDLTLL